MIHELVRKIRRAATSTVCIAFLAACNEAPTEPAVRIEPTAPVTTQDLEVVISADSVDPNRDDVEYVVHWFRDGTRVDGLDGATRVPASTTTKGEVWSVDVRGTDGSLTGTSGSAEVTVLNSAPEAELGDLPIEIEEAATLIASASAVDADDDTVTFSYQWFVNGQPIAQGQRDTLTGTHFDAGDTVFVEARPHDGEDSGEPVRSTESVVSNTQPTFSTAEIDPDEIFEDTIVSCVGSGFHDNDGDSEGYVAEWTINGGLPFEAPLLDGKHFDKADVIGCTLWAWDGTARSVASAMAPSRTVQNTPPSLQAIVIDDPSPDADQVVTASPQSLDDADGDSIQLSWSWKVDGVEVGTDEALPAGRVRRDQQIVVTVTPSDDEATGISRSSSPVTASNAAPRVTSVAISPADPSSDATLAAVISTVDGDGDTVTVSHRWVVDGVRVGSDTPTLDPSHFGRGQTVHVEVTPTDGIEEGTMVASQGTVVRNAAPSIVEATVDPAIAFETTTLVCVPTGWSDVDDDDPGYTWRWSVNGIDVATTEMLDGAFFDKGDTVACAATPFDGDASGVEVLSLEVVVQNSAPELATAELSPDPAYEGSTLTATPGEATDVDGDVPAFTFAWSVDGADPGETGATLDGAHFDKGASVTVTITPTDGDAAGLPVTSDPVVILNTPPRIDSVGLTPDPAYTDSSLSAVVVGDDDDSDAVTYSYAWFHQDEGAGAFVELGATTAMLAGSEFDEDDVVYVEVTANDGTDDSAPFVSDPVTIDNSAPEEPGNVTITPNPAMSDVDLVCSWDVAADADGESSTYEIDWMLGGVLYAEVVESGTSTTLLATNTADDDVWSCEVTAIDPDGASSAPGESPSVPIGPHTIKCNGTSACQGGTRTCPDGVDCIVECGGVSSCGGATIRCPEGGDCDITCDDLSACQGADIVGGSGDLTLLCSATSTCQGADVTCGGGACSTTCTGSASSVSSVDSSAASSFVDNDCL